MTGPEVGKLLGLMSLADYRKVPDDPAQRDAMIAFWLSLIGDLSYEDAVEAVRGHYAQSTERMMPAHVRAGVRSIRQERLARTPDPEIPRDLLDDPDGYRARLLEERHRIASGATGPRAIEGGRL